MPVPPVPAVNKSGARLPAIVTKEDACRAARNAAYAVQARSEEAYRLFSTTLSSVYDGGPLGAKTQEDQDLLWYFTDRAFNERPIEVSVNAARAFAERLIQTCDEFDRALSALKAHDPDIQEAYYGEPATTGRE